MNISVSVVGDGASDFLDDLRRLIAARYQALAISETRVGALGTLEAEVAFPKAVAGGAPEAILPLRRGSDGRLGS